MLWQNRQEAGQQLAKALEKYRNAKDTVVFGLPRGGVVVAAEIAKALHLPLDIIVTRKIGAPGQPELAIGAIDEDGNGVWHDEIIRMLGVSKEYIDKTVAQEKIEAERRMTTYRGNRPPLDLQNKTAILVDDGVATGATMLAAIASARSKGAQKIVVAAPVIAPDTVEKLKTAADEIFYLDAPSFFAAVGHFYKKFEQTTDQEVSLLLA